MWWIFTYAAYATLAAVAIGAAGYAAVTQLALLQRLVVVTLEKWLRQVAANIDGTSNAFEVWHTDHGVELSSVAVGTKLIRHLHFLGEQVASAAVAHVEVLLPTFSQPLAVRLSGVRLHVQQVKMPKSQSAREREEREKKRAEQDKATRLAVVEHLLWGSGVAGTKKQIAKRSPGLGTTWARLQVRGLQKLLGFLLQYVELEVQDLSVRYTQYGEPGPRPAANYLQGADAAVLQVRRISLLPQGAQVEGLGESLEDVEAWEAEGGTPPAFKARCQGSFCTASKISRSARQDAGVAKERTSPRADSDGVAPAAEGQPPLPDIPWGSGPSQRASLWQVLLRLPGALWGNIITDKPSSTHLQVVGVSLVLQTYPTTWPEYHAAQRAASGATGIPSPAGGFAFTAGKAGGGEAALAASKPAAKLRGKGDAFAQGAALKRRRPLAFPGAAAGGGDREAKQRGRQTLPAPAPLWDGEEGAVWVPHDRLLAQHSPEEHTVFRQWECTVTVSLLPPGYQAQHARGASCHPDYVPPSPSSPGGRPLNGGLLGLSREPSLLGSLGRSKLPAQHGSSTSSPDLLQPLDSEEALGFDFSSSVDFGAAEPRQPSLDGTWFRRNGGYPPPGSSRRPDLHDVLEEGEGRSETLSMEEERGSEASLEEGKLGQALGSDAEGLTPTAGAASGPFASGDHAEVGASPPPAAAFTLDVGVSLKALLPELNAASVAILNRLLDRELHFVHFGEYWEARPRVPVHEHAGDWWRHAGGLLRAECSRVRRRQLPLRDLARRRQLRLQYHKLYAASHVTSPGFQEPGRRWWHRRRVQRPAAADVQRLQEMERELSTEEVAHFRFGVAATHNSRLARNPGLLTFVVDKLNAVVFNRDPLSSTLQSQLSHTDQASAVAANPSGAPSVVAFRLRVGCPKAGLALDMRPAVAAAAAESRVPYLAIVVQGISVELTPEGALHLHLASWEVGRCASPTSPIPSRMISTPSMVCHRLCKAAEFFRYSLSGLMLAPSEWRKHETQPRFVTLVVRPRPGQGGYTVDTVEGLGQETYQEWQPGGVDLDIVVAAVSVTYEQQVFTAALRFVEAWEVCHSKPWCWAAPQTPPSLAATAAAAVAGAGGPAGAAPACAPCSAGAAAAREEPPPAGPPPLPLWPTSVADMVLRTLAVNSIPVAGCLTIPSSNISLLCPGVALELPYYHEVMLDRLRMAPAKGGARGQGGEGGGSDPELEESSSEQLYMFIAALQQIKLIVNGEGAWRCMQNGCSRRIDVSAYLDVFSYMSQDSRKVVAQHLMPSRGTFDTTTGSFMGESEAADQLAEQLRDVEISAMAKVWAYPEDMPAIMEGIRSQAHAVQLSQSFKHRLDTLYAAQARGASASFVHASPTTPRGFGGGSRTNQFYPMPLIPFVKSGDIRVNVVEQLCAVPGEVGGAELSIAASLLGGQVWVSPLHIWHLVSLAKSVRKAIDYVKNSPIVADAMAADKASTPQFVPDSDAGPHEVRKQKVLISAGIGQVSILWMIGTWTPKTGSAGAGAMSRAGSSTARGYRRSWGITVKKGDPAFLWAQWLAPVYSVGIANIVLAFRQEGSGKVAAGLSVDGIIVRDLQLPEQARHAYVLRPLPARAKRLNTQISLLRRQLLGIVRVSPAKDRWIRACQAILLRRRTSSVHSMDSVLFENGNDSDEGKKGLSYVLFGGALFGPQIRLRFKSVPAARARPSASDISAEVGQMLAYVRIKQQASMTAFVNQVALILAGLQRPAPKPPAPAAPAQPPTKPAVPTRQSALKVRVTVVGIDVLFRVSSRDLLSLKLQQGRAMVEQRAITASSGPRDVSLYVSSSIQDIMVQDLQADPSHSLVLIPNGGADYCTLTAAFTSYVDSRKVTPSLVLQIQNPRILLLFRFVVDIMNAVSIITSTASEAAKSKAEGGATHALPPQAAAAPPAVDLPAGQAGGAAESGSGPSSAELDFPIEVVVQLQNVGLIVPTSTHSRTALGAQATHLLVAVPGSVLPSSMLDDCDLPAVDDMIAESLLSNRTYKFSGFHDGQGAGGAGPPAAGGAAASGAGRGVAAQGADQSAERGAAEVAAPAAEQGVHQSSLAAMSSAAEGVMSRIRDVAATESALSGKKKGRVNRQAGVLFLEGDGEAKPPPKRKDTAPPTPSPQPAPLPSPPVEGAPPGGQPPMPAAVGGGAPHPHRQNGRHQELDGAGEGEHPQHATLKGLVGSAAHGIRGLVDKAVDAVSVDFFEPPDSLVVDRFAVGGKGAAQPARGRGDTPPADASNTLLTPLEDDTYLGEDSGQGELMPQGILTVCAEHVHIFCGDLIKVPNFYYQKEQGPQYENPLRGSFVPASLGSFSWPVEVWDLVAGSPFIHQANLAVSLFKRLDDGVFQLHFCTTPLCAIFNAPNFTGLIDFIEGNLGDFLKRELINPPPGASRAPEAGNPPQVQFNPSMKFGPRPGQHSFFRLTLASPSITVLLEADPEEWGSVSPAYQYKSSLVRPLLRPFFRGSVSNLLMDMGCMDDSEIFINFCATSLDLQDLRPAYRLQSVTSQLAFQRTMDSSTIPEWACPPSGYSSPAAPTYPTLFAGGRPLQPAPSLQPPQPQSPVSVAASGRRMSWREIISAAQNPLFQGKGEGSSTMALPGPAASGSLEYAASLPDTRGGSGGALPQHAADDDASPWHERHPSLASQFSQGSSWQDPAEYRDTPGSPSTGGTFTFQPPAAPRSGAGRDGPPPSVPPLRIPPPPLEAGGREGSGSGGRGWGDGARSRPAIVIPPTPTLDPLEHTGGIKMSVARRLSEKVGRKRLAMQSFSQSASPEQGQGGRGQAAAAAAASAPPHMYSPVIDTVLVPEMAEYGIEGGEAAAIVAVTTPVDVPPDEIAHSRAETSVEGANPAVKLEVSLAILNDSTVAVEVALSNAILNWPYFQDLSLIWSISNLFTAPWHGDRPGQDEEQRGTCIPVPDISPHPKIPAAWLYVNVVATESQIFVPVYDVSMAQHIALQLWDFAASLNKSEFEKVADLALACMLLDQTDTRESAVSLEERGLALSWTVMRFGYAYGGDGETNYKVDLRDFAAFVRDPQARVNSVLHPFSLQLDLGMKVPQAAEHSEVERMQQAALTIQRAWRLHCLRRSIRNSRLAMSVHGGSDASLAGAVSRGLGGGSTRLEGHVDPDGTYERFEEEVDALVPALGTLVRPWKLVDELVSDVASPHTRKLLKQYRKDYLDRNQMMYLQRFRARATTALRINAGMLTLRAAFSHIAFWQTAMDSVKRVVLHPMLHSGQAQGGAFETELDKAAADAKQARPAFRPSSLQVDAAVQSASVVLCNDKPETFGAPDVLQCRLSNVDLSYDMSTLLHDRPPNQAAKLFLQSNASFLNSSTSRWEALFDVWPLQAEYVDIVSPMYLSDRKKNVWLQSEQHLDLNFNPASLLSVGDMMAFYRTFTGVADRHSRMQSARLGDPHAAEPEPEAATSRALDASRERLVGRSFMIGSNNTAVLSRAPQKYLVQNQSGMKVYYWADSQDGTSRSHVHCLDNGASENLRVPPATKRLNFTQVSNACAGSERLGSTINLHFEGNWMPIRDVSVSVVGKYLYRMTSPADNTWLPVIIDIILVGRTKVITLHSAIWVENAIDREVSFRLHVPTTPLVPPTTGLAVHASRAMTDGDITVGPLKPGAGTYLPLTAVLGGSLFLKPSGYQEAARDVVRLSPNIPDMLTQQGYISCDPSWESEAQSSLHVALQASPAKLVSAFQAFKHMECVAPRVIQRACAPLEVHLSIQPTMVLHNALPYEMRVLLCQAPLTAVQAAQAMSPHSGESVEPPSATGQYREAVRANLARESQPAFPGPNTKKMYQGRYFTYVIKPGGSQDIYADLRQYVMMHVSVEEIGVRSTRWSQLSAGFKQQASKEGVELQFTQKLPKEIPLRMVGVGMSLPASQEGVFKYVQRLKEAALHLHMLHVQFHHDARMAVNTAEVAAAVGRIRILARRMSQVSTGFLFTKRRPGARRTAGPAGTTQRSLSRKSSAGRGGSFRPSGETTTPAPVPVPAPPAAAAGVLNGEPRQRPTAEPQALAAPVAAAAGSVEGSGAPSGAQAKVELGTVQPRGTPTHTPPPVHQGLGGGLEVEVDGEGGPALMNPQPSPGVTPPPGIPTQGGVHKPGRGRRLGFRPFGCFDFQLRRRGVGQPPPTVAAGRMGSAGLSVGLGGLPPDGAADPPGLDSARTVGSEAHTEVHSSIATSAHPSPSNDSRVSGWRLLPGASRSSDWAGRSRGTTSGAAEMEPYPSPALAPGGEEGLDGLPAGCTRSEEGATTVELEAVPESPCGAGAGDVQYDRLGTHSMEAGAGEPALVAVARATSSRGQAVVEGVDVEEGEGAAEIHPEEGGAGGGLVALSTLRACFDHWRDVATNSKAHRVIYGGEAGSEGGERAASSGLPSHPEEPEEDVQVRSPPVLYLGVYNSLEEKRPESGSGSVRITLFAPYWLNNRTGVDLFYKDKASAPGQPLLFGAALPWDFSEVFTPGTSMTEMLSRERSEGSVTRGWGTSVGGDTGVSQMLEYRLVLMNKQKNMQLGLSHVPNRQFSPGVTITTVGNKGTVELKGPPRIKPPVHEEMLSGLRDAALAGLNAPAAMAGMLVGAGGRPLGAVPSRQRLDEQDLNTRTFAAAAGQAVEDAAALPQPARLVPIGPGGISPEAWVRSLRHPNEQLPFPEADPAQMDSATPSSDLPASANVATGTSPPEGGMPGPERHSPGEVQGPQGQGSRGSRRRHARRLSSWGDITADVTKPEPGTMLVRLRSGRAEEGGSTPKAHQPTRLGHHRSGSSMSGLRSQACSLETAFLPDDEVQAAADEMRRAALPGAGEASSGEQGAPARQQLSEAVDGGETSLASGEEREAAALEGEPVVTVQPVPRQEGSLLPPLAEETLPPGAAANAGRPATAPSSVAAASDEASREAAAVAAMRESGEWQEGAQLAAEGPEREVRSRLRAKRPATELHGASPAGSAPDDDSLEHVAVRHKKRGRSSAKGQRLYEFAVDVAAGPPESIFRHTKLVTLKPKYIIENQTGLPMAVKQLGSVDPVCDAAMALQDNFACVLLPDQRSAIYWDDADLPRELVIKPVVIGEEGEWHWSGGFPIPETEWYFGLRIRHRRNNRRYINIPINVTVGSSGSVQVTLKSPNSVPPYRIENTCKDVQLLFIQVPLVFRPKNSRYLDNLQPGEVMPYAWDEPTMLNKIRVQAKVSGKHSDNRICDYALDHLGDLPLLLLPTHSAKTVTEKDRFFRTLSSDLPDELKQKLVSLLAAEYSKKVYVTVYADGPTRVLRFSDEKNVSSLEQQNVILDLAARLKQVELQLREVNTRFARLYGVSGSNALDLYGRSNLSYQVATQARSQPGSRRTGKKLPISSSAQALVRLASDRMKKSSMTSSHTGSPGPPLMAPAPSAAGGPSHPSAHPPTLRPAGGSSRGGHLQRGGSPLADRDLLMVDPLQPPRTSTVRFDMEGPAGEGSGWGGGSSMGALPGGPAPQGVGGQADELERYRALRVDTQAEPVARTTSLHSTSPFFSSSHASSAANLSAEIQPAPADAQQQLLGGAGEARVVPTTSQKDWGHITPSGLGAGGLGAAGRSLRKIVTSVRNQPSKKAALTSLKTRAKVQGRQELLRGMTDGDAVLLIGGDLTVTVEQAQGLWGVSKDTHPFARVTVLEPFPTDTGEERSKQTTVMWQSTDPVWDEQLLFRDVCAASELVVEVWDLGGSKSNMQLQKLSADPQGVIRSCRFLGRAEVPLSETLDVPAGTPLWFQLMRRGAGDAVSGEVQLRFMWDVTAKGLLSIKLNALSRVLQQRQEILSALQPVPAEVSQGWCDLDPEIASDPWRRSRVGASMGSVPEEGMEWAARPSRVAAQILTRHAHDYNRRHLSVTVLEARGLAPRRGVVVALSANELPNPRVTVSMKGHADHTTPIVPHTLTPRWDAKDQRSFQRVDPAAAKLVVRLYDERGGVNLLRDSRQLVGEGTLHCGHIRSDSPVYVWMPLSRYKNRRRREPLEGDETSDLQVYLRVQWLTEVVRGASVKVEVDMAGLGLMVMGGLQDELFNLTLDSICWTALSSKLELTVEGRVQKVQLDNQMLEAVQPVVLAPAAEIKPTGTLRTPDAPLITFNFVRSYAGSGSEEGERHPADHSRHIGATLSDQTDSEASQLGSVGEDKQGIKSFKDIRLSIGRLDLMTDEAFLEAVLSFMSSIPTADIMQDKPWVEQQHRLLSAQFGPKEVERLARNEMVPLPEDDAQTGAMEWVVAKETKVLELLHGQSDLSSWFFIESAEISAIEINVTVCITSRLLSSSAFGQDSSSPGNSSSAFNRALGASGFQLVNVGNVPIMLGKWMVGNDPSIRGRFSNGFLSQKALANNLIRHYTREGLKEAHKVLGGSGPAVAAVPLTMLWASGNVYTLVRSIAGGSTGPVAAMQQVVYVPLMALSLILSGFSRMTAAFLAFVPPGRMGGDDATVQRIIRRPNNALEAFGRAPAEFLLGLWGGASGVVFDPMAGYQSGGRLGLAVGAAKALLGLGGRPLVGVLEAQSKVFSGLALMALGREGIIGKIQRRVKAPGAFVEDEIIEALDERSQSQAQLYQRCLMDSWQSVLPDFFPQMAQDVVTDVISVRPTRVLLVTDRHVAYLRARHYQRHSIYKAKWLMPVAEMQNLRGSAETLKISITQVHRYDLWVLGVWPVQKRKGLRCVSRTMYERTVAKLSRLLQQSKAGYSGNDRKREFVPADLGQLTILNGPYHPPQDQALVKA